jgi:hypothetical protein
MDEISKSSYSFYLTGSRFFGNNTACSDIDLMVAYNDGLVSFLTNLGFVTVRDRYDDSSINGVYSLYESVLVKDGAKLEAVKTIDVQVICSDEWLDRKIRAQEALRYSGLGERLSLFSEEDKRGIWESILNMALKSDIKLFDEINNQKEIISKLSEKIACMKLMLDQSDKEKKST